MGVTDNSLISISFNAYECQIRIKVTRPKKVGHNIARRQIDTVYNIQCKTHWYFHSNNISLKKRIGVITQTHTLSLSLAISRNHKSLQLHLNHVAVVTWSIYVFMSAVICFACIECQMKRQFMRIRSIQFKKKKKNVDVKFDITLATPVMSFNHHSNAIFCFFFCIHSFFFHHFIHLCSTNKIVRCIFSSCIDVIYYVFSFCLLSPPEQKRREIRFHRVQTE